MMDLIRRIMNRMQAKIFPFFGWGGWTNFRIKSFRYVQTDIERISGRKSGVLDDDHAMNNLAYRYLLFYMIVEQIWSNFRRKSGFLRWWSYWYRMNFKKIIWFFFSWESNRNWTNLGKKCCWFLDEDWTGNQQISERKSGFFLENDQTDIEQISSQQRLEKGREREWWCFSDSKRNGNI